MFPVQKSQNFWYEQHAVWLVTLYFSQISVSVSSRLSVSGLMRDTWLLSWWTHFWPHPLWRDKIAGSTSFKTEHLHAYIAQHVRMTYKCLCVCMRRFKALWWLYIVSPFLHWIMLYRHAWEVTGEHSTPTFLIWRRCEQIAKRIESLHGSSSEDSLKIFAACRIGRSCDPTAPWTNVQHITLYWPGACHRASPALIYILNCSPTKNVLIKSGCRSISTKERGLFVPGSVNFASPTFLNPHLWLGTCDWNNSPIRLYWCWAVGDTANTLY